MSEKGTRRLSFTREVRLVLLLILLLIVALNSVTSLIFSKAKAPLEREVRRDLATAGAVAAEVVRQEKDPAEIAERLWRLRIITRMQEIRFWESAGSREVDDDSWRRIEGGEELLHKRQEGAELVYLRPAYNQAGDFVGAIFVRADAKAVATLNSLSFLDASIRLGGTIGLLLLGFIFLRKIMSPFRRMLKDSQRLNGDKIPFDAKSDEVETIMETFSKTISELKKKERTLQELYYDSERRAHGLARYNEYILRSISSGVIICSTSGLITRFNPAAEKILGYQRRSVLNYGFQETFGPENPLTRIINDALNEERTHSRLELEIRRGTGEIIQVGLTSFLIRDEGGGTIGVFILLTDISKIKKLEKEMLFKQQLAALGEMSAGLAHELRNGMATITGYSGLLKRNLGAPENLLGTVEKIIRESSAMELMLSHFLDFARQEDLKVTAVRLCELASEAVVTVNDLVRAKEITLKVGISATLPSFEGDGLLLRQATQNLLLNACQAVGTGGRVGLFAYVVGNHQKVVKIICLDDGVGVSEELREKIFYPFTTTKEKGTGLGLPLVKKVVLLHGGTIEVKSRADSFTAFIIRLPLREVAVEESTPSLVIESR